MRRRRTLGSVFALGRTEPNFMSPSVPPASGHFSIVPDPLRRCRRLVTMLSVALLPLSLGAQNHSGSFGPATPRGQLLSQRLELTAPDDACLAYLATFTERRWSIRAASRQAFLDELRSMGFSAATRQTLDQPTLWQTTAEPDHFTLTPPIDLLLKLPPPERFVLYRILAQWQANKVERWPLVFRDRAAIEQLAEPDGAALPSAAIKLVQDLSVRFAGGFAFSDFSVLAARFPDRELQLRFLRAASTVDTVLPRLSVRNASSVTETLAYWTSDHRNPFSEPMLMALLESRTERGVELASLLPGSARALSYDLDPAEVSHDTAINSLVISASIAAPAHTADDLLSFLTWFNDHFQPATDEARFGDLMVLNHPDRPVLDYACAFIADDLVFAKDPVGLGLWRFMRVPELLARNPHFAGGQFIRVRFRDPSP